MVHSDHNLLATSLGNLSLMHEGLITNLYNQVFETPAYSQSLNPLGYYSFHSVAVFQYLTGSATSLY